MSETQITDEKFQKLTKGFNLTPEVQTNVFSLYSHMVVETKHKMNLSSILTLIKDRIVNQEVRHKRTTNDLASKETQLSAPEKKRLNERLKSIEFKLIGLKGKRDLIMHLINSIIIEDADGNPQCVECGKSFKYKTESKVTEHASKSETVE